jgi:hypothetical protein
MMKSGWHILESRSHGRESTSHQGKRVTHCLSKATPGSTGDRDRIPGSFLGQMDHFLR